MQLGVRGQTGLLGRNSVFMSFVFDEDGICQSNT